MSQVRVVALERGHDGRVVREAGEEFMVAAERLRDGSNWFVAVNSDDAAKAQKAAAQKAANDKRQPPGIGPKAGSREDTARPPGAGPVAKTSDLA